MGGEQGIKLSSVVLRQHIYACEFSKNVKWKNNSRVNTLLASFIEGTGANEI